MVDQAPSSGSAAVRGPLSGDTCPSRRQVIGGGMAALAAFAAPKMAGAAPPAATGEVGVRGGVLRLGLTGGATSDTLAPADYKAAIMACVGRALYNGLVEWLPDGSIGPELADSWEPRGNGQEWIFTLRKGVLFADGKEFDASDAAYSLNLHRGESRSGAGALLAPVTDIEVIDRHHLRIRLISPDIDFPHLLTDYHLMMVPNHFSEWDRPVGTGAFVLERFEPGERIMLRNRGDYWKPGRGLLDAIEINIILSSAERHSAAILGKVDFINNVDPKFAPLLLNSGRIDLLRASGGAHSIFAMRSDLFPYSNPNLRRAFKYAINREQIMRGLLNGYGTIANDHPVPPTDPYFNSELEQTPYDPEKAAFYLKQADGADARLVLTASDGAINGTVDLARQFQADCALAGLRLAVDRQPADGFRSDIWLRRPFVAGFWAGRASALQMLSVAYDRASPWNETHWDDGRFQSLLIAARAEADELRRKAMIWDMQAMLSRDGGAIIPVFRDWVQAVAKNVGGITATRGMELSNGYICERAWMRA